MDSAAEPGMMPSTPQPFFDPRTLPDLTFFATGGTTTLVLGESEARIAALAATLAQRFPRGVRVGLLYRSEPALPLMWLAALHAGLEPLILQYPTEKQSLAAWRFSVDNTVRSVRLAGLICSPELQRFDVGAYNPLFHSGHVPANFDAPSRLGSLSPDAAILQMSSGTTGQRKAIRFTLRQLGRHADDYNATLGLSANDRVVSWLPLYHDMGFIACFVTPLLLGVPVAMIDPMDWVRRPGSLFDAIETVGGTLCFLPNFGFEVMTRHAKGRRFPTMRRWISCSEPVYASTLERFAAATGTPDSLLSACYAMAENVFAVAQHDGIKTARARRALRRQLRPTGARRRRPGRRRRGMGPQSLLAFCLRRRGSNHRRGRFLSDGRLGRARRRRASHHGSQERPRKRRRTQVLPERPRPGTGARGARRRWTCRDRRAARPVRRHGAAAAAHRGSRFLRAFGPRRHCAESVRRDRHRGADGRVRPPGVSHEDDLRQDQPPAVSRRLRDWRGRRAATVGRDGAAATRWKPSLRACSAVCRATDPSRHCSTPSAASAWK